MNTKRKERLVPSLSIQTGIDRKQASPPYGLMGHSLNKNVPTQPAGDVFLGAFVLRVGEDLARQVEFHQFASSASSVKEEGCVIRNAPGLLHIVRHDHDGVLFHQLTGSVPLCARGNRIERSGRFIHQVTLGFTASARAMHRRFCCPPERASPDFPNYLSLRSRARRRAGWFPQFHPGLFYRDTVHTRTISNVVKN
jgi:hypothetical protein